MFGRLGPTELILILIMALLVFGPAKLPEIGKAVGKGLKEFKSAAKDFRSTVDDDKDDSESNTKS